MIMDNEKKYYIYSCMWSVVQLFIAGGVLQSLFLEFGFSGRQVGNYVSMANIAQILIMIGSVFWADKVKQIRETIAWMMLSPIPFVLFMLFLCFWKNMKVSEAYAGVMLLGFMVNLIVGFYNILCYRFPYLVIDIKNYSRLTNNQGIINNVLLVLVSGAISFLAAIFSFRKIMTAGFIFTIVLCIITTVTVKKMKIVKAYPSVPAGEQFFWEKLKQPVFRYFLFPNFLRGISDGTMGVITVICAEEITDRSEILSLLVTVNAVALILGSALYQAIRKKVSTVRLYMFFGFVMCLFFPSMILGKRLEIFIICYFTASIGYAIVSNAGAIYPTEIIGYYEIGTYTSIRFIAMTLGKAVAGYGVAVAMDYVPTMIVLLVSGICQATSGIFYYRYDVRYRNSG